MEISPIKGNYELYYGDDFKPTISDNNITTSNNFIRINKGEKLFHQDVISYLLINAIYTNNINDI